MQSANSKRFIVNFLLNVMQARQHNNKLVSPSYQISISCTQRRRRRFRIDS